MTHRVHPRWLRRLRSAWLVLTAPRAQFDHPLTVLEAQRRRRNVEHELGQVTKEILGTPTPIADELDRFQAVKTGLALLITEYEHKGLAAPAIIARLKRLTGVLTEPMEKSA